MGGDTKRGVLRHAVQGTGWPPLVLGSRECEHHANERMVLYAESGGVQNLSRDIGIDVNTSINPEAIDTVDSNEGAKRN